MQPLELVREFWPSAKSAGWGACCGGLVVTFAAWLAGFLALRGWRVGDTRKIFHFMIFTTAALLRALVDTGAVVVFGSIVALTVMQAVWRGPRSPLFRAVARPSDSPHEKLQVIAPLGCTAVGGVLAQLIAGPLAVIAYLVGGWGDAVGEPIGIRWGRHRYPVPAWGGVAAQRSWEGTLAVLIASTFAAGLGLYLTGRNDSGLILAALFLGVSAAIVEAISPHGWDNLTLLVAIACLSRFCGG